MKRILLLTALLGLAACHHTPRKGDQDDILNYASQNASLNTGAGKFSVQTPGGWSQKDTVIRDISFTVLTYDDPHPGRRPNVNIISESMRGTPFDQYVAASLRNMTRFLVDFVLIDKGEKNVGGQDAEWLRYTMTRNGVPLDMLGYIIPRDGVAYLLTCSAAKGQMVLYQPAFDQIVGSFRFN